MKNLSILFLPVLSFSCSAYYDVPQAVTENGTRISVKLTDKATSAEQDKEYTADIFVFDDDRLQRLDSYQRIRCRPGEMPSAASQNGKKIIAAIINPQSDSYGWDHISSFQALQNEVADLKKETGHGMLMSGVGYVEAGKEAVCDISISALAAEVQLRSLRCDFSGKPYQESAIKDVKAYLTNVNAVAKILQKDGFSPETLCNQGGLVKDDVLAFADRDLIVRKIGNEVGSQTVYPDISLICYPNECMEETAGSPFTRLVIEGRINGQTCYYPININRDGRSGTGISRNCRYIFDVTLKSTGSSDPDTVVSPADIDIACLIAPWDEKDNTEIIF